MSIETLTLLRAILGQQNLAVGATDFSTTATQIIAALRELDFAIENFKE